MTIYVPPVQSKDDGVDGKSVDGYLVIYSVTDRSTYRHAQSCLQELRPAKRLNAVILVANKSDVVRNRVVSTAGSFTLNASALKGVPRKKG